MKSTTPVEKKAQSTKAQNIKLNVLLPLIKPKTVTNVVLPGAGGDASKLQKKVPDYNTNVLKKETSNFVYHELEGLPKDGWIHGCIFCDEVTTRIENIFTKKAYICKRCSSTHAYPTKFKKIGF